MSKSHFQIRIKLKLDKTDEATNLLHFKNVGEFYAAAVSQLTYDK